MFEIPLLLILIVLVALVFDFTNGALITGVTETDWPGAWLAGTIIFKS